MIRVTIAAILERATNNRPLEVGPKEVTMVMNRLEGLAWLRKQVESADKDILAEIV